MTLHPRHEGRDQIATGIDELTDEVAGSQPNGEDVASFLCVDLFCGAGGFSLGAIEGGFEVRGRCRQLPARDVDVPKANSQQERIQSDGLQ